jgi:dienelactone hydrolase
MTLLRCFARFRLSLGSILAVAIVVGGLGAWRVSRAEDGAAPEAMSALFPEPMWRADAIRRGATIADDLTFPQQAEAGSELPSLKMTMLKPTGDGPFPAIVLMHQCGGLNAAVASWARKALARSYVVLLIDSLGPRGVKSVCYGPKSGVNLFRGLRDALQGGEYLRRQPFVDGHRVALIGFSWGAMVGLLASSSHYAGAAASGSGFSAVAGFYPGCFTVSPPNDLPPFEILNRDIEHPLLVLMGSADTETPASQCLEKLEALRKSGAPVDWHIYDGATHCWDCKQIDGLAKIDVRGHHVEYRFDPSATTDSENRLFEWLDRVMGSLR